MTNSIEEDDVAPDQKDHMETTKNSVIEPHSELPKPEPPPGVLLSPPTEPRGTLEEAPSAIKYFIKDHKTSFSASIEKGLSFLSGKGHVSEKSFISAPLEVTRMDISGLKVIVREKKAEAPLKGRISFFSRSNCRDCAAIRSFFRDQSLPFVEINIDVFPKREKELVERAGTAEVPRIFFNDRLFGGLVALNSLRNSGDFDRRVRDILKEGSLNKAPIPPLYGADDEQTDDVKDLMLPIVRILRQKLPIQDRLLKMKIINNCFSGEEMLDVLDHHFRFDTHQAIEVGKELTRKHFIHIVAGKPGFVIGNHFRFLEHEKFIQNCHNFRGVTNDNEPKAASMVASKLHKIMCAIVEAYASEDRCHVDYPSVATSEEFRRYVNLVDDLQRVDLLKMSQTEKQSFFLNLYNAMVIHAVIRIGLTKGAIDRRAFYSDFQYVVGGDAYSLNAIKNGVLRGNRRSPYSIVKPFGNGDRRLEMAFTNVNPLVHFGLCNGTRSSPAVRFFCSHGAEAELRQATREFFQNGGIEVNLETRCVRLSRILSWFSGDFGQERQMVKWVLGFLDGPQAGLLTHLMNDGGPINVVYDEYNWSINTYTV